MVLSLAAGAVLLASPALAGLVMEDHNQLDVALGAQGILLYDYESGQDSLFDSQAAWDFGNYDSTSVSPTGSLELAPLGDVGPDPDTAWWDPAWASRQCVVVTNTGDADSERPTKFTIDTASLIDHGWLADDAGDLRAVDSANGQELPYWVSSDVPSASTSVWIQLADVPTGDSSICLYFGNAEVESLSDEFGVYTFATRTIRHYTLTNAFDGSEGESGQVRVVSYADGVVVSNGTIQTTLNRGESDTFSGMTQHSYIDATGPISATGLGDNTDSLVPESLASTDFIFAADRNVQQFWVRSPEAETTIEVVYDNAVVATHTITPATQSFPISLDALPGSSVVLRSTNEQPFLVAHDADGADSIIGIPWTNQTLYGLRSTQMQLGTGVSGATITTIGSDGGGEPGVLYGPNIALTVAAAAGEAPEPETTEPETAPATEPTAEPEPEPAIEPEPAADPESGAEPTAEPETAPATEPEPAAEPAAVIEPEPAAEPAAVIEPEPAAEPAAVIEPEPATAGYAITADLPIGVSQFEAEGDESTSFLPLAFLDNDYFAPASFSSATLVCPTPGSTVTMIEPDGTVLTLTCATAGEAGSPGLAGTPLGDYPSGTRFTSANKFFLKIDKLGTDDDTNVFGPRIIGIEPNLDLALANGLVEGTLPPVGSWKTVIDTGDAGVFGLLTALGSIPDEALLTIQIASASTAEDAALTTPVGPDGTVDTSFALGTTMVPYGLDNDQFVHLSIELTAAADAGPSLVSLNIDHNLKLLDIDGTATAAITRSSSPSTGYVARVRTNPATPMTATLSYLSGENLPGTNQFTIRTDHPDTHVAVVAGSLTQGTGSSFAMDSDAPFSILYEQITTAETAPSLTIRLLGEEPNGFIRSNDISITIEG